VAPQTQVERALFEGNNNRIVAAAVSATRYYHRERDILVNCVTIAKEHLERSDISGEDRVETEASLRQFEQELADFDRGWQRSSIRKAVKNCETRTEASGAEQRVAMAMPSGLSVPSRAAGTTVRGSGRSKLVGYASVFNEPANIGGHFIETVMPGAFSDVLHGDTVANFQHLDLLGILARTTSGSLRLSQDRRGLHIEADLLSDSFSSGIRRRVRRGDLSKISFAFADVTDRWQWASRPGELDHRQILRVGWLGDVAVVVHPAYEGTSVWVVDDKRAADIPHEPSAGERFDVTAIVRQAEAEEDAEWERNYALEQVEKRLGIVTPRQRELQRAYEKAGRIIYECERKNRN
jgi:uncharacterized protein